jgi:hypothetical protein
VIRWPWDMWDPCSRYGRYLACRRKLSRPSCGAERGVYPLVRDAFAVVKALGVDPQQYLDTMPGSLGHLGHGHSGVQPQRYSGMAQVVGAAG